MITLRDDAASVFGSNTEKTPLLTTDHIAVHTMRDDLDGSNPRKETIEKKVNSLTPDTSPFGASFSPKDAMPSSAKRDVKQHPSSPTETFSQKKRLPVSIFAGVLLVFVIVVLAGGGYYFLLLRNKTDVPAQEQAPAIEEVMEQPSQEESEPEPLYSETLPNYFAVNTEEGQQADIVRTLTSAAEKIMAQHALSPVEFVIVDNNNTPVSFHVFALLYNLSLPQDLLSALEEKFSLYIVPDGDTARIGIAISLKDAKEATIELQKAEVRLFENLAPLFLDKTLPPTPPSFKDSVYAQHAIRYANGDVTESFSVDYTFTPTHLVIGTSKNSMRAIIDKRDEEQNTKVMENSPFLP